MRTAAWGRMALLNKDDEGRACTIEGSGCIGPAVWPICCGKAGVPHFCRPLRSSVWRLIKKAHRPPSRLKTEITPIFHIRNWCLATGDQISDELGIPGSVAMHASSNGLLVYSDPLVYSSGSRSRAERGSKRGVVRRIVCYGPALDKPGLLPSFDSTTARPRLTPPS